MGDSSHCRRVDQHDDEAAGGCGEACAKHHDETVRNVRSKRVQCDEIWSFNYAKQKNVVSAKAAPQDAGDLWTWTALDANSKLIVSYLIGGRDAGYTHEFMQDVARRLANPVQLTTDGHKPYLLAVEGAFGADVDYGPACEAVWRHGSRGRPLQPGRLHRHSQVPHRGQPREGARQH